VPEQDSGGFGRLAEDVGHLLDLVVLLGLYLGRVEDCELDLVRLFGGLDILVLRLKPHIVDIVVGICGE
jgi:hypothetical protein